MTDGKPLLPEGSPFELWDVRLVSGDVKMTVDELDAAFEAGHIDGATLVRRRGTIRWETLAKAANLDPPEPPNEPAASRPAIPRPAVPRPNTAGKETVRPPPLPASELARVGASPASTPPPLPASELAHVGALPASAPPPPPPIEVAPILPARVEQHVSSLPPPVTVSTAPEPWAMRPPIPSLGEDTDAAIRELLPRRRGRLFAVTLFVALIGGGAAATWKVPTLRARAATVLHRFEKRASPPLGVAAAPPPASAQPLPPSSAAATPPPATSASASATSASDAPRPAASHKVPTTPKPKPRSERKR